MEQKINRFGMIFVKINVVFFVYLFAITESLSLFHNLTMRNVIYFWSIFVLIICIYYIHNRRKHVMNLQNTQAISESIKNNKIFYAQIMLILLFAIVMFFYASNIVPYNWDSMTYHCSRIMNWIQNKSVDYYPTNISKQLYSPPFTEYVVMHTYFFFKSDIAFNLVQWYAYVVDAIMIFLICYRVGVRKEIAAVGSLLCLTMPMAIAQSVTTETDLFAGMWLLFFVYIVIYFISLDSIKWKRDHIFTLVVCAATIGLGYLTKSQICISMAFFLLWMLIVRLKKKDKIGMLMGYIVVAAAIVLIFISPSFVRNYSETGDIFASSYFSTIAIGSYHPKLVLVNFAKNWAHTSLTFSSNTLNEFLSKGVHFLANMLGVNIDDLQISFEQMPFDPSFVASYHCDAATNPFIGWGYLIAIILGIVWFVSYLVRKSKSENHFSLELVLFLAITSSFVVIRWQPWVTRLLVPAYLLIIIFCILIIHEYVKGWGNHGMIKILSIVVSVILVFSSYNAINYQAGYYEDYKKSQDRFSMYFADRDEDDQYRAIVEYLNSKDYNMIGIYLGYGAYEYPLWVALKNDTTQIIQVVPGNPNADEEPECIIAIHYGAFKIGTEFEYLNKQYVCTFTTDESGQFSVLEEIN